MAWLCTQAYIPSKRNRERNVSDFNSGYFLVLRFKVKYSSLQLSLFFNVNLCYFFKKMFIHLLAHLVYMSVCLCVRACVCTLTFGSFCACYGTHVEVKGQLKEVISFLEPHEYQDRTQAWPQVPLPTGSSHLQPWVFKIRINQFKCL